MLFFMYNLKSMSVVQICHNSLFESFYYFRFRFHFRACFPIRKVWCAYLFSCSLRVDFSCLLSTLLKHRGYSQKFSVGESPSVVRPKSFCFKLVKELSGGRTGERAIRRLVRARKIGGVEEEREIACSRAICFWVRNSHGYGGDCTLHEYF